MTALLSEQKVLLHDFHKSHANPQAYALQAKLMQYGYVFENNDFDVIMSMPSKTFSKFATNLIQSIESFVGADRNWTPMYPNFPKQVAEASDLELFRNAINHYWSFGQWKPEYTTEARVPHFPTSFKTLELINEIQLSAVLVNWLSATVSLNDAQLNTIKTHIDLIPYKDINITFKETLAFLATVKPNFAIKQCKTPTDVLRVASALSGGDFTLKTNTKFDVKIKHRKKIAKQLEYLANRNEVEFHWDMAQNINKWQKFMHHLMVHKNYAKYTNLVNFAHLVYNKNLKTFESDVQRFIDNKKSNKLITLLSKKQGVFVRKLNEILTKFPAKKAEKFIDAVDFNKLPNRMLWQLFSYFQNRNDGLKRIIKLPSGKRPLTNALVPIDNSLLTKLQSKLKYVLKDRYKTFEIGKVSDDMKLVPLPLNLRGDTTGTLLPKGTRIPFNVDIKILRFGVHWYNTESNIVDIDMSNDIFNDNFTKSNQIGWNADYRTDYSTFSGDITNAPNPHGASEFIDIDIEKALTAGMRYATTQLYVFSGGGFKECQTKFNIQSIDSLETDSATLKKLGQTGEAFEPSRLIHSVDINNEDNKLLACLIDLKERHIVWLDIPASRCAASSSVNDLNSNTQFVYNLLKKKEASLFDLFSLFTYNPELEDVSWETNFPYKISEYIKYL